VFRVQKGLGEYLVESCNHVTWLQRLAVAVTTGLKCKVQMSRPSLLPHLLLIKDQQLHRDHFFEHPLQLIHKL